MPPAQIAGEIADDEQVEKLLSELGLGVQLQVTVPEAPRHRFVVMKTLQTGLHSGRPRYLVVCTACEKLLHDATTGVWPNIQRHIAGRD